MEPYKTETKSVTRQRAKQDEVQVLKVPSLAYSIYSISGIKEFVSNAKSQASFQT